MLRKREAAGSERLLTKVLRVIQQASYKGTQVQLPDGTLVGLRGASKSGGPAIDIRYPDGSTAKIHVGQ